MSDFLGRLAARTLGSAQVVQPMGRAMFGPGAGWESADRVPDALTEIRQTVETGEGVQTSDRRTPSESADQAARPESSGRGTGSQSSADFLAVPPLPIREYVLPDRSAETDIFRDRVGDNQNPESQVVREPAAASDGRPVMASPASELTRITTSDTATLVAGSRPEVPATRLLVPQTTIPGESGQFTSFHAGPGPASHDRASARASAPVVRVSIGRVEVRAEFSTPAARPAAHRTQPSSLSLEEYARQRQEGKR